jgi:hypothetical protein
MFNSIKLVLAITAAFIMASSIIVTPSAAQLQVKNLQINKPLTFPYHAFVCKVADPVFQGMLSFHFFTTADGKTQDASKLQGHLIDPSTNKVVAILFSSGEAVNQNVGGFPITLEIAQNVICVNSGEDSVHFVFIIDENGNVMIG